MHQIILLHHNVGCIFRIRTESILDSSTEISYSSRFRVIGIIILRLPHCSGTFQFLIFTAIFSTFLNSDILDSHRHPSF